jgi:release factor glutamine methyltransferase
MIKNSYKQIVKKYTPLLREVTHIPQKEIEILLLYILEKNVIWLHIHYNELCDIKTSQILEKLVKKRATNYPIEYITSKVSFYGETFSINDGVLIPRPQTEILVEKAEIILKNIQYPKVVEVGSGSGIISIMLAILIKDITIIAVDINDKALALAKQNAINHKVEHKITFIKSNIFNEVDIKDFDMCISNPPYIASSYRLPSNVKYEPSNALFGGEVGDELLKNIITQTNINNIKYLLCEMGYDQKKSLNIFLKDFKVKNINFYKDLEGFDRGFETEFL